MSAVSKQEALQRGLRVYCDSCKIAYEAVPLVETKYGNKAHECPNCSGDIFFRIEDNQLPRPEELE